MGENFCLAMHPNYIAVLFFFAGQKYFEGKAKGEAMR